MNSLINVALEARWDKVAKDGSFKTPDAQVGVNFTISHHSPGGITISTEGGTPIAIKREAFVEALAYLIRSGHLDQDRACEIGSTFKSPGRLSRAVSAANGNPSLVIVTYVLPILATMGLVAIDGSRPNKVWLAA